MPSRPVLIGRTLATQTPNTTNKQLADHGASTTQKQDTTPSSNTVTANTQRVHTIQPPPPPTPQNKGTRQWSNRGSQSYGGHSDRETPGPIPNPEVKPASADGTATERLWESRTPPDIHSGRGHPSGWPLRLFDYAAVTISNRVTAVVASSHLKRVSGRGRPATEQAGRVRIGTRRRTAPYR